MFENKLCVFLALTLLGQTAAVWPFFNEESKPTNNKGYVPLNSLTFKNLQENPSTNDKARLNIETFLHNKLTGFPTQYQVDFNALKERMNQLQTQYAFKSTQGDNPIQQNSFIVPNPMGSSIIRPPKSADTNTKYVPFTFYFDNTAVTHAKENEMQSENVLTELNNYVYKTVESYYKHIALGNAYNTHDQQYPHFIENITSPVRFEGPTFYIPIETDSNEKSKQMIENMRRLLNPLNEAKQGDPIFGFTQGDEEVSFQELQGKSALPDSGMYANLPNSPIIWVFTTKKYEAIDVTTPMSVPKYPPQTESTPEPTIDNETTTSDMPTSELPLEIDITTEITQTTTFLPTVGSDSVPFRTSDQNEQTTKSNQDILPDKTTSQIGLDIVELTTPVPSDNKPVETAQEIDADKILESEEASILDIIPLNDSMLLESVPNSKNGGPIIQVNIWNYINGHLQLTGSQNFPSSMLPEMEILKHNNTDSIPEESVISNNNILSLMPTSSNNPQPPVDLYSYVTNNAKPMSTYFSNFSNTLENSNPESSEHDLPINLQKPNSSSTISLEPLKNTSEISSKPAEIAPDSPSSIYQTINQNVVNTGIQSNQVSTNNQLTINNLNEEETETKKDCNNCTTKGEEDTSFSISHANTTKKPTVPPIQKNSPVMTFNDQTVKQPEANVPTKFFYDKYIGHNKPIISNSDNAEEAFLNRIGTKELLKQYVQRVMIFTELLDNSNIPRPELTELIENLALQSLLSHYLDDISSELPKESITEIPTTTTQEPTTEASALQTTTDTMIKTVNSDNAASGGLLNNLLKVYQNAVFNRPTNTDDQSAFVVPKPVMRPTERNPAKIPHQIPPMVSDQMIPTRQESGDSDRLSEAIANLVPEGTTFQGCLRRPSCAFTLAASLAVGATFPIFSNLGRKKRSARKPVMDDAAMNFEYLLNFLEKYEKNLDSRIPLISQRSMVTSIQAVFDKLLTV